MAAPAYVGAANWAAAYGNMQDESFCNGVWSAILKDYYPFATYVIAPERYLWNSTRSKNMRADLAVLNGGTGAVRLIYEGKKETAGVVSIENAISQCLATMKIARCDWGVCAVGSQVTFLKKVGEDAHELYIQRSGNVGARAQATRFDVNGDNVDINTILTYLFTQTQ